MLHNRVIKPGYKSDFIPQYVTLFGITLSDISYKIRQKFRQIEYLLNDIRNYSSSDIRLYLDTECAMLVDYTSRKVLFNVKTSQSLAILLFKLEEVATLFTYDRFPQSVRTQSQYNHYVSLKTRYYGQKN